jgi:hypothetical protein
MKNVFLIPTDKPTGIFESKISGLQYSIMPKIRTNPLVGFHLYITNLEEIKNGEWCLDKFNQRWKLEDKKLIGFDNRGIKRFSTDNISGHECKKIILTTDQDLIKNGVQAIDDEFLEWFVKNPSCESVDVETTRERDGYHSKHKKRYKIIIPQEEPKQEFPLFDEEKADAITKQGQKIVRELQNTIQQETLEEYEQQVMEKYAHEFKQETLYTEEQVKLAYMQGYNRGKDGNPNHMESYIEFLKQNKKD